MEFARFEVDNEVSLTTRSHCSVSHKGDGCAGSLPVVIALTQIRREVERREHGQPNRIDKVPVDRTNCDRAVPLLI